MKSVKKENNEPSKEYPSLWTYNNMKEDVKIVVLFTAKLSGTVVYCQDHPHYEIGYHSDDWCVEGRIPYNGTITISND